jgi:hypothetical protein
MHIFLLLLFALALFGGGLFGRLLGLIIRIAFVLILAAMFIHPPGFVS